MSRRITEYVGIGDINPTAALHIAPLHTDEVALKIQGSQSGTQTGNLMEILDSSGSTVRTMDKDGNWSDTFAATATEAMNITGVVTGESTGTVIVTRKIFKASSASNTVVTASTFTVPNCGAMAIHASIVGIAVCGAEACSAGYYDVKGFLISTVAGSGAVQGQIVTPVATANATWAVALAGFGANSRTGALTVAGTANAGSLYSWVVDVTTITFPQMD